MKKVIFLAIFATLLVPTLTFAVVKKPTVLQQWMNYANSLLAENKQLKAQIVRLEEANKRLSKDSSCQVSKVVETRGEYINRRFQELSEIRDNDLARIWKNLTDCKMGKTLNQQDGCYSIYNREAKIIREKFSKDSLAI